MLLKTRMVAFRFDELFLARLDNLVARLNDKFERWQLWGGKANRTFALEKAVEFMLDEMARTSDNVKPAEANGGPAKRIDVPAAKRIDKSGRRSGKAKKGRK